jgi:NAD(P)-dependent dehydrogenase (short-subunit alcohol dehydrogenase family)
MNEASLHGRHAVVTGASRGIGVAVAAALVKAGACVSLLARDPQRLEAVAEQLGAGTFSVKADVTSSEQVTSAFQAARENFGPVHILINNAGQAGSAKFTDTDETFWHGIIGVNLTGTFLCTRHAVPDMLAENFGRIVNVASIAGLRGAPYLSAYATSKHAVIGFTRALALEYAARNITVNAVCPGYVDTDMVKDAISTIRHKTGRSESEARAALIATNPQRRLIEPQEVAHAVLWLCTPGATSVNGQSLILSGGEVT